MCWHLVLGFIFYSTGIFVCLWVNIKLFLLEKLYNVFISSKVNPTLLIFFFQNVYILTFSIFLKMCISQFIWEYLFIILLRYIFLFLVLFCLLKELDFLLYYFLLLLYMVCLLSCWFLLFSLVYFSSCYFEFALLLLWFLGLHP